MDGFVLTDDPFVENLVETEKLVLFSFQKAGNGDSSPACDDLTDFFGSDLFTDEAGLGILFLVLTFGGDFRIFQLFFKFGEFSVLELSNLVQVIRALGCFDLLADLVDLLTDLSGGFHSSSFRLPSGMKCIPFGFQVGQFFFENLQPLLGGRIFLLF